MLQVGPLKSRVKRFVFALVDLGGRSPFLVLGVALDGPVGVGTIAFSLGIGPAVQLAFRLLRQTPVRRTARAPA